MITEGMIAAAFFSSLLKGVGSIFTEESNYQNDLQTYNLYADAQDRYIERQRANLEATRQTNAVSAMAGAVERVLTDINGGATVEANRQNYSKRLTQYTEQYADQVGTALALTGTTGFRNTGSNINRVKKASQNAGYNLDYLRFGMNQSIEEQGYNSLQSQISRMDAMIGYRFNIKNAITQTNMLIEEAEASKLARKKELNIDNHDERLVSAFWNSFLGTGISYGTDMLITKIESEGAGLGTGA